MNYLTNHYTQILAAILFLIILTGYVVMFRKNVAGSFTMFLISTSLVAAMTYKMSIFGIQHYGKVSFLWLIPMSILEICFAHIAFLFFVATKKTGFESLKNWYQDGVICNSIGGTIAGTIIGTIFAVVSIFIEPFLEFIFLGTVNAPIKLPTISFMAVTIVYFVISASVGYFEEFQK